VLIGPPLLQASISFIFFVACEFSPLLLASNKAQRAPKSLSFRFPLKRASGEYGPQLHYGMNILSSKNESARGHGSKNSPKIKFLKNDCIHA
jgi:hypothetical protein